MIYIKIDDVAKGIGVSASTIKKYYLLFEGMGYMFKRNQQGQLMFTEQDVRMFQELIKVKNKPGIKLSEAAKKVISSITDITVVTEEDITDITDITPVVEGLKSLKELMEQQQEMIKNQQLQINQLIFQNEQNQLLIESKESERDKLLMQNLRETQELKKLILESNLSWWKKLFKKQYSQQ